MRETLDIEMGGLILRILVADDHDLVRRGLKQLLTAQPGWSVVAEAKNWREAGSREAEAGDRRDSWRRNLMLRQVVADDRNQICDGEE